MRAALAGVIAGMLRDAPGLEGAAVFDAPPSRAAHPFVLVGEPVVTDLSAGLTIGREARVAVLIEDGGEQPDRLRALVAAAEAALASLPAVLPGGWRVTVNALARSRLVKAGGRWVATIEWRVRLWREDA